MAEVLFPQAGSLTVILADGDEYHPLGMKISILPYRFPERFSRAADVIEYLGGVQQKIANGSDARQIASEFFHDLNLCTANIESFKQLDMTMWRRFEETYRLITAELLKIKVQGSEQNPADFGEQGLELASDFLRPLAYYQIPEDPGSVWGYVTPRVNTGFTAEMPAPCASRNMVMDAQAVLNRLINDLQESFERRQNPRPYAAAKYQCSEPQHPARYRLQPKIFGPNSINEEGNATFTPEGSVSQLEFGENYKNIDSIPALYNWEVTRYTCEDSAPLKAVKDGNRLTLTAPRVLDDSCIATIRLTMEGPYASPAVATKDVKISNTDNEPPSVVIEGQRTSRGGGPVKLFARAKDPNGDPITYSWEQISGLEIQILDGAQGPELVFLHPWMEKKKRVQLRVTVTDHPQGENAGAPMSVEAKYIVTLEPVGGKKHLSEKQKGLLQIAQATGGDPFAFATLEDLPRVLVEAATPDSVVDGADFMILRDRSGSMGGDEERVREAVPRQMEAMRQKVKTHDPKKVRVGVASYVDDDYTVHLPLKIADQNAIQTALDVATDMTRKIGGFRETIWDALYLTIERQPWKSGEKIFRKIIFITDEEGDIGRLGKRPADIARLARAKGIAFQPIFLSSSDDIHVISNLEVLTSLALALHSDDDHLIKIIEEKFLPIFNRLTSEDRGFSDFVLTAVDLLSKLILAIRDPQKRLAEAKEHILPITTGASFPTYPRAGWKAHRERAADDAYCKVILSLPDEGQRVLQATSFLKTATLEMNKVFLTYGIAKSIPDEGRRINFIEAQFVPIMVESSNADPRGLNSDTKQEVVYFAELLEGIKDHQKRAQLARKHLAPLMSHSQSFVAAEAKKAYQKIVGETGN